MEMVYIRNKFLTFLAVFAGLVPLITFTASYITALKLGHLKNSDKVPFIRHTTSQQPESTVFSLGLCTAVLIHITLIYARYMQVLTFRNPACPKSNDVSCYFGPLLVFGESIVSAFRHSDSVWAFYFGKTIFFTSSCIYIGIQAYISIHTPAYHRKWTAYTRCVLTVLSSICPILSIVGISIKHLESLDVPQAAELALLIVISIFWMTFAVDFKDNNIVYLFRYYEMQSFSQNVPNYGLKIMNQNGSGEKNNSGNMEEDRDSVLSDDQGPKTMKQIITSV